MKTRHALLVFALAAGLCISPGASAQEGDETTRAAVRALAAEGDVLLEKGDYSAALDRFRRAAALIAAPTVRLREATCLEKLGKWIEAADLYRKVSRTELKPGDPASFRQATEQAATQAVALDAKIPKLVFALSGSDLAGATIEVDGQAVPSAVWATGWPVNPGKHRVVASKGDRTTESNAEVKEAEKLQVTLVLRETAAPPIAAPPASPPKPASSAAPPASPRKPAASVASPSPSGRSVPETQTPARSGAAQRTWGWVSLGLGGAGLAVGVITTGMASSKKSTLESDGVCADNKCTRSMADDDVNSYNSLRTYSMVGYAVGAVGLGAGLLLLLTAPSEPEAKSGAWVRPWIGAGSAGMVGRF